MVLGIVRNRDPGRHGNAAFIPAFYEFTDGTSVTVDSELISFTQVGSRLPQINRGNAIRIEVFALDGSDYIDTEARQGALFMDTVTVRR